MKRSLLMVLIFGVGFLNSFSQNNTSSKEAIELKKRILIVGLEEQNPKMLKKLKGKELEFYQNQVDGNNYALQTSIEKYWKYNSEIKYLPLKEAKALLKSKPKEYALLTINKYTDYEIKHIGKGWTRDKSLNSNLSSNPSMLKYDPGTRYTEAANQISYLSIDMPSNIIYVNLPNLLVSFPDGVYGVMQMQYILDHLCENEKLSYRDVVKERNGANLKNKTLLLCKDDLDKKLTEAAIKKIYPYKFKIASLDEINQAIVDLSPDYVIAQIVSVQGGKGNVFVHFLSETSNGCIDGLVMPSFAIGIKGTNLITYNQRIKEKQLKEYLEIADSK